MKIVDMKGEKVAERKVSLMDNMEASKYVADVTEWPRGGQ